MAISALRLPPLSSSSFNFPCSTPNPNPNPNTRIFRLPKPSAASALDAKFSLLSLISHQNRGLKSQQNPSKQSQIVAAIEELALLGKDTVTTDSSLSGTWRLLWTTEKEQLFIINASWFGTKTGDVLQVIDVESGVLNNVITFPPSGVFFARSTMECLILEGDVA